MTGDGAAPNPRPRFAVVDYGAGNLVSIEQGLTRVGAAVTIAHEPADLLGADALIVPGVGAAAPAMERLAAAGLVEPIQDWTRPAGRISGSASASSSSSTAATRTMPRRSA